jgi:cell wall-associated NlpC family hydrolase
MRVSFNLRGEVADCCGRKVDWADRRAGDAVFFGGKKGDANRCSCQTAASRKGIHHVGLMMDDGWRMWNALKTGTNVREDRFDDWSEAPCPQVIRFV